MRIPPDGLPVRSTLCTNPAMIHTRISGCFPCIRGFFAALGSRFDSQMDRCLTRNQSQPRREADIRSGHEAARPAGPLRHEIARVRAVPCRNFSFRPDIFQGWEMGCLSLLPEHTVWRSRSDGTERLQLTFAPMDARFPAISPDGTKVAFHTVKNELFVVDMQGDQPRKVADNAFFASWSPDGNYLFSKASLVPFGSQITDLRTGKSSVVPSSEGTSGGYWLSRAR